MILASRNWVQAAVNHIEAQADKVQAQELDVAEKAHCHAGGTLTTASPSNSEQKRLVASAEDKL